MKKGNRNKLVKKNSNDDNDVALKEITVDELAMMCQRQFSSIDERFDGVQNELITIRQDIKEIKHTLNTVLLQHDQRITALELRSS